MKSSYLPPYQVRVRRQLYKRSRSSEKSERRALRQLGDYHGVTSAFHGPRHPGVYIFHLTSTMELANFLHHPATGGIRGAKEAQRK